MRQSISEKETQEKLSRMHLQVRQLTQQLQATNEEKTKLQEKSRQEITGLQDRNKMLLRVSRQERKQK